MNQKENKTKFYVGWSLVVMVIGSIALAWIMGQNMQSDVSKDRFKLTKIYKEIKDESYVYNEVRGKELYLKLCVRCHRADGTGSSMYPSLSNQVSPIVSDKKKIISVALNGLQGKIVRGDKTFNGSMPGYKKIDHNDLAHILNYIRTSLGDVKELITHVDVIKHKVDTISRRTPYTESEL